MSIAWGRYLLSERNGCFFLESWVVVASSAPRRACAPCEFFFLQQQYSSSPYLLLLVRYRAVEPVTVQLVPFNSSAVVSQGRPVFVFQAILCFLCSHPASPPVGEILRRCRLEILRAGGGWGSSRIGFWVGRCRPGCLCRTVGLIGVGVFGGIYGS